MRASKRHGTLVASLTGRACHDMGSGLADRGRSVVAACAATRNAGVVEPRAGERHGALVTGLTGRACNDVGSGFADRGRTIVAIGTSAANSRVVKLRAGKRHSAFVTGFAWRRCENVRGRLTYSDCAIVTPHASPRRAFKAAIRVAARAVGLQVPPNKRKPGRKMIEDRATLLRL